MSTIINEWIIYGPRESFVIKIAKSFKDFFGKLLSLFCKKLPAGSGLSKSIGAYFSLSQMIK